jgi:hypothetical protein
VQKVVRVYNTASECVSSLGFRKLLRAAFVRVYDCASVREKKRALHDKY